MSIRDTQFTLDVLANAVLRTLPTPLNDLFTTLLTLNLAHFLRNYYDNVIRPWSRENRFFLSHEDASNDDATITQVDQWCVDCLHSCLKCRQRLCVEWRTLFLEWLNHYFPPAVIEHNICNVIRDVGPQCLPSFLKHHFLEWIDHMTFYLESLTTSPSSQEGTTSEHHHLQNADHKNQAENSLLQRFCQTFDWFRKELRPLLLLSVSVSLSSLPKVRNSIQEGLYEDICVFILSLSHRR